MTNNINWNDASLTEITRELERIIRETDDLTLGSATKMPRKNRTSLISSLQSDETILGIVASIVFIETSDKVRSYAGVSLILTSSRILLIKKNVLAEFSYSNISSVKFTSKNKLAFEFRDRTSQYVLNWINRYSMRHIVHILSTNNQNTNYKIEYETSRLEYLIKIDRKTNRKKSKRTWITVSSVCVVGVIFILFLNTNEDNVTPKSLHEEDLSNQNEANNVANGPTGSTSSLNNSTHITDKKEVAKDGSSILVPTEWEIHPYLSDDPIISPGDRQFLLAHIETRPGLSFTSRLATTIEALKTLTEEHPYVGLIEVQNYEEDAEFTDSVIVIFANDGQGILSPLTLKPEARNYKIMRRMNEVELSQELRQYAPILFKNTPPVLTTERPKRLDPKSIFIQNETNIKLYCKHAAESQALFDTRWSESFFDFPKFSNLIGTSSKDPNAIIVLAQNFEVQNAFGAWAKATVKCTYSPGKDAVIFTEIISGGQLYEIEQQFGPY